MKTFYFQQKGDPLKVLVLVHAETGAQATAILKRYFEQVGEGGIQSMVSPLKERVLFPSEPEQEP